MARRIAVELSLDAQRYLLEARKVEGQTATVDEIMRKLGKQVDDTGDQMVDLAAKSKAGAKGVDDLGEKANKTSAEMTVLDRRIAAVRRSLAIMNLEFKATGDAALGARIFKQNNLLQGLESLQAGGTGFALDASKVGAGAASGVAGTPGLGPVAIGAIIAAVAAAAPAIGAILAGAVVGTVGTGGIVGGVLSASHDPRVKTAFAGLADDAKNEFFLAGKSFVEPTLASIGDLRQALKGIDLASTFALAAPDLKIIVDGLAALVKNLLPGLNTLLARSGPFAQAAAQGFAGLGTALSEFLDNVSASPGAIEGLTALFNLLGNSIKLLGATLKILSDIFHGFNVGLAGFFTGLDKATTALGIHDDAIHDASINMRIFTGDVGAAAELVGGGFAGTVQGATATTTGYGESLNEAAHKAQVLTDAIVAATKAIDDQENAALGAWDATIKLAKGYSDLQDEVDKGAKGWDLNTRAGQTNQQMIADQIKTAQQARDTAIALGDGTEASANKAIAAYDAELKKILDYAAALGATKAQIEALAHTYYATLIVTIQEKNQLNKANAVDKAMQGRASGGPVGPGSYWVGENGPEMLTLGAGSSGYVTASTQAMKQWSGSGGGNTPPVVISFAASGDQFVDSLVKQLRKYVRVNGALVTN